MTARPFLDTNVLVYAALEDRSPGYLQRIERAETILRQGGVVSVQVFHEFADVARRKFKEDWPKIAETLLVMEEFCGSPLPITVAIHRRALDLAARYRLRIYDAVVVSSAIAANCDTVFTEDLQHGQVIEGLWIENPFRELG